MEIVLFSLVYRPAPKGLGPQYPRGRVRSREKEELTSPPTLFPLLFLLLVSRRPRKQLTPSHFAPSYGKVVDLGNLPFTFCPP